jgi:hypothetical protein
VDSLLCLDSIVDEEWRIRKVQLENKEKRKRDKKEAELKQQ